MSQNKRYSSSNSYSNGSKVVLIGWIIMQCTLLKTRPQGVTACLRCLSTSLLNLMPTFNTHSAAWQHLRTHISQMQHLIHKLLATISKSLQVSTLIAVAHISTGLNPWSKWKEIYTWEVPWNTALIIDFVQSLQNSTVISISSGLSSLRLVRVQLMVIPMQLTWCTLITWTIISMAWWYLEMLTETWFRLLAIRYSKQREMAIQLAVHREELTSSMSSPTHNHQLCSISGDH